MQEKEKNFFNAVFQLHLDPAKPGVGSYIKSKMPHMKKKKFDLVFERTLGKGYNGYVILCRYGKERLVAVKIVIFSDAVETDMIHATTKEVFNRENRVHKLVYSKLGSHVGIVIPKLYDYAIIRSVAGVHEVGISIMQYISIPNNDMTWVLRNQGSMHDVRLYFKRMISTLTDLHRVGVIHGDLHTGNFKGLCKKPILIDFGRSVVVKESEHFREKPDYAFLGDIMYSPYCIYKWGKENANPTFMKNVMEAFRQVFCDNYLIRDDEGLLDTNMYLKYGVDPYHYQYRVTDTEYFVKNYVVPFIEKGVFKDGKSWTGVIRAELHKKHKGVTRSTV